MYYIRKNFFNSLLLAFFFGIFMQLLSFGPPLAKAWHNIFFIPCIFVPAFCSLLLAFIYLLKIKNRVLIFFTNVALYYASHYIWFLYIAQYLNHKSAPVIYLGYYYTLVIWLIAGILYGLILPHILKAPPATKTPAKKPNSYQPIKIGQFIIKGLPKILTGSIVWLMFIYLNLYYSRLFIFLVVVIIGLTAFLFYSNWCSAAKEPPEFTDATIYIVGFFFGSGIVALLIAGAFTVLF